MDKAEIDRINFLARKKKAEGLTNEETREQWELRQKYLKEFRDSLQGTLDRVYLQQEDGSYKKLEKKKTAQDAK
ncbi:MAG: DUF896 domain-containing protein [Clostridia bacterium]|nr:DUF896 domain-containing protein [Clostridia bacterium]